MPTLNGFTYQYIEKNPGGHTLLLLHGTGGDENDLLDLGAELDPQANLLSPRGEILENGMPRSFRRLAPGVFDEADIVFRTDELAEFIEAAGALYQIDRSRMTAVGYSNGANIAASLFLLRPEALDRAILLRPMLPLTPEMLPDLSGKKLLVLAGKYDELMPAESTTALTQMLQKSGAQVELVWQDTGHALISTDVRLAQDWLK